MDNSGYVESFPDMHTAASSDEDLVEIAGATLDFSSTDDVPPLDRDFGTGRSLNDVKIVTHVSHNTLYSRSFWDTPSKSLTSQMRF